VGGLFAGASRPALSQAEGWRAGAGHLHRLHIVGLTSTLDRLTAALASRYTIERELGAGGMATVYLAEDLKHHRKVAVKVLRPELAATMGPERFLREIEVAARLQHPHILPLHDSGEAEGFLYYVMPYVQGESLRDRVARERELPIHDALRIVTEVADALACAHEQGVVHRDIKPENILLSGRHALVTDFGVAKAVSEATGRLKLTSVGVALGTPTYMAPEQAAADPKLDHRVDIYALGVVAYELLAGRPPFTGHTAQEILAAHLTRPPEPIRNFRGSVAPAVETIVLRCLEKHPADRWQTTSELVAQLEPLATPSGGMTPTHTVPVEAIRRRRIPMTGWVVGVALLLAAGLWFRGRGGGGGQAVVLGRRTAVTLDPGLELDPALSPDGKLLAYAAGPPNSMGLYVRQLDGGRTIRIIDDSVGGARSPHWSPDGNRIAFRSRRGIELVPSLGGPLKLVAERSGAHSPAWAPNGESLAYVYRDTLFQQALEGGPARVVAVGPELHSLAFSSDGRWIACASGNLAFVLDSRDLGNLAPSRIVLVPAAGGAPIPVTSDGALNNSPAWQPGQSALYFVSTREGGRDIYRVEIDGSGRPRRAPARISTGLNAHGISLSGDGSRLAYSVFTETVNVWSFPVPGGAAPGSIASASPVTTESQIIEDFSVSPDGRWLAFDSDRGGNQHIYRRRLDGGDVEQLTSGAWDDFFPVYSPDGAEIVFHSLRNGNRDLFTLPATGGAPVPVVTSPDQELTPTWSPDGRSIAYSRGPAGLDPARVVIAMVTRTANGWGEPRNLAEGGGRPVWSGDGKWVAYLDVRNGEVRVVSPVSGGPSELLIPAEHDGTVWRPDMIAWSADSRSCFVLAHTPAGVSAIWRADLDRRPPRLAVRFDDPSRQPARFGFRLSRGRFYLTLGNRQSDIWVADVNRQ
jgi:eukaryotic-like serine/threonine-protein kinase